MKPSNNLTFNYQTYNEYLGEMVQLNVKGNPDQNYIIQMIDYIVDPTIKQKNYIVLGDV